MSRNMFWKFYFLSIDYSFKMRIKFDRMYKDCFYILTYMYIFLKK